MKINNKGYASTIIMFSILTLFLISMLMLVKTMSNSSSLNKKITEKVVDNIDYDSSGTMQDRLTALENKVSNLKSEVINEIYPVGSIYMSTEDDTIEKVQSKFGGTWEKYSEGRTLIGDGTDESGYIYQSGQKGGNKSVTLSSSNIPSLSVTGTTNSTGSGYSIQNTCTNRTTSTNGSHSHGFTNGGQAMTLFANSNYSGYGDVSYGFVNGKTSWWSNTKKYYGSISAAGNHTHTVADCYANNISGVEAHTHTFTGTYTNNNVSSINTESPYTVIYMYKRKE